jgi:hypothetical protein
MNVFYGINIKIHFAIVAFFVFLISVFLLLPFEQKASEHYNIKKLRQNINVSFQVPSPGKAQVQELLKNQYIKNVFPYFDLFTDITIKNKKGLSNYYAMLVADSQLDTFPFIQEKMLIKKSPVDSKMPLAFIDYAFSKRYNLSVLETIDLNIGSNGFSIPIVGIIYDTNKLMHVRQGDGEGTLIVSVPENIISELEKSSGKIIQYGGAYITTENNGSAKTFLKDYKPYGRLKDRNLFTTQDEYAKYLGEFNNISYAAEIRDLSGVYSTNNVLYLFDIIPITLLTLLVLITLVLFSFNSRKYMLIARENIKNGSKVSDIIYSVKEYVTVLTVFIIVLYLIVIIIIINLDNNYYSISFVIPVTTVFFTFFVLAVILLSKIYLSYYRNHLSRQLLENEENIIH